MNSMREFRKAAGLTMKQLGEIVGMSESTISLYERGFHEPDIETMTRIADALHVSIDRLLGREQQEKPASPTISIVARGMEGMTEEEQQRFIAMARAAFPNVFDK